MKTKTDAIIALRDAGWTAEEIKTVLEAQEVIQVVGQIVTVPTPYPVYPSPPVYPYDPFRPPYIITCDSNAGMVFGDDGGGQ